MLALTRGVGESIILFTSDGEIEIKVIEVRSAGQVRIGIDAPDSVDIERDENLEDPR